MHGHSLSTTRKLNRHWQSGSKGTGLEENLVFFERELNETEWPIGQSPYWIYNGEMVTTESRTFRTYSKRNVPRDIYGFRDLVILQPGDYKVHWNFATHDVERVTRDGETYERITSANHDNKWGMYGAIMYGMADPSMSQYPVYKQVVNADFKYYAGHAEDYLANGYTALQTAAFYANTDIVKKVNPSRSSTASFLTCPPSFNLVSGYEQPEVILHIGGSAPFPRYKITIDTTNKTVWFKLDEKTTSPCIAFLFVENVSSLSTPGWAITGKLWLERIGDFTPDTDGWQAAVLEAPSDYTILGNRGIIS